MIFSFLQRAVALIDTESVAETETRVSVDVKGRHSAGFRRAQVQSGDSGIGGRSRSDAIRINPDAIAIETEPEVGHDIRTQAVSGTDCNTLVARGSIAGKKDSIQPRTSRLDAVGAGRKVAEISERIPPKQVQPV